MKNENRKTIVTNVPEEIDDKLTKLARDTSRSKSGMVMEILKRFFANGEKHDQIKS